MPGGLRDPGLPGRRSAREAGKPRSTATSTSAGSAGPRSRAWRGSNGGRASSGAPTRYGHGSAPARRGDSAAAARRPTPRFRHAPQYLTLAATLVLGVGAAIVLTRPGPGEALFQRSFEPYPSTRPIVRGSSTAGSTALALYEARDYRGALAAFEDSLGREPNDAAARFYAGLCRLALGPGPGGDPRPGAGLAARRQRAPRRPPSGTWPSLTCAASPARGAAPPGAHRRGRRLLPGQGPRAPGRVGPSPGTGLTPRPAAPPRVRSLIPRVDPRR